MQTSAIIIDLAAVERSLRLSEGLFEDRTDSRPSELEKLGFKFSVPSNIHPARFAFDDGVVGWVVGVLENGTPAVLAFESSGSFVGHGDHPVQEVGCLGVGPR